VFEFRRQRRSLRESFSPAGASPLVGHWAADHRAADQLAASGRTVEVASSSTALFSRWTAGDAASRRVVRDREREAGGSPRELPDVTGFLVVVLVTLGLFVVPVGATLMQGPAIVASILGR